MKAILLVLIPFVLFAQYNPDGKIGYPSFHISPYYFSGSGEYETTRKIADIDYPSSFGFDVAMKIPASEGITITGFFRYIPLETKVMPVSAMLNNETNKGRMTYFGFTLSIYTQ